MTTRACTLVLLAAITVAAACGDDGGGIGGGSVPEQSAEELEARRGIHDTCLLLTESEVEQLVGAAEAQGVLTEDTSGEAAMPYAFCRWGGPDGTVEVAVIGSATRFEQREQIGEDGEYSRYERIEDLGEGRAFASWNQPFSDLVQLSVLVGDRTVEVGLDHGPDTDVDTLIEVTRAVLERI